jgi:hypothetical protein
MLLRLRLCLLLRLNLLLWLVMFQVFVQRYKRLPLLGLLRLPLLRLPLLGLLWLRLLR